MSERNQQSMDNLVIVLAIIFVATLIAAAISVNKRIAPKQDTIEFHPLK